MATQYFPRSRQPSAVALRAEALIDRYPNLSEIELAELINLMNRLPMLDFGLIAADDRLADRMDAFHRDHGDKLGPSLAPGKAVSTCAAASIMKDGIASTGTLMSCWVAGPNAARIGGRFAGDRLDRHAGPGPVDARLMLLSLANLR